MANYPANLVSTARHLHDLLAARRYAELESICGGKRLSADDIAGAIRDYGCQVASAPEELDLDVVKIESARNEWSVNIPVFTWDEGKSDLTLEVTMTESFAPLCTVEIDNLHVM